MFWPVNILRSLKERLFPRHYAGRAWKAPPTFIRGEKVTGAQVNTSLNDNLRTLLELVEKSAQEEGR